MKEIKDYYIIVSEHGSSARSTKTAEILIIKKEQYDYKPVSIENNKITLMDFRESIDVLNTREYVVLKCKFIIKLTKDLKKVYTCIINRRKSINKDINTLYQLSPKYWEPILINLAPRLEKKLKDKKIQPSEREIAKDLLEIIEEIDPIIWKEENENGNSKCL
jgi:hypothetical protein